MLLVFDVDDDKCYLMLADPLNDIALEEIQRTLNRKAQVFITTPSEVLTMLDIAFTQATDSPKKQAC